MDFGTIHASGETWMRFHNPMKDDIVSFQFHFARFLLPWKYRCRLPCYASDPNLCATWSYFTWFIIKLNSLRCQVSSCRGMRLWLLRNTFSQSMHWTVLEKAVIMMNVMSKQEWERKDFQQRVFSRNFADRSFIFWIWLLRLGYDNPVGWVA